MCLQNSKQQNNTYKVLLTEDCLAKGFDRTISYCKPARLPDKMFQCTLVDICIVQFSQLF